MERRLPVFLLVIVGSFPAACASEHEPEPEMRSSAQQRRSGAQKERDDSDAAGASAGAAGSVATIPPLGTLPIGTLPTFECDASAESEASCGDTTCPELPDNASASCMVTCCTADAKCGVRTAAILGGVPASVGCIESAVADSRCPSSSLGATTIPGCCDFLGHCGLLYGTVCLSSAAGVEPKCDAASED